MGQLEKGSRTGTTSETSEPRPKAFGRRQRIGGEMVDKANARRVLHCIAPPPTYARLLFLGLFRRPLEAHLASAKNRLSRAHEALHGSHGG